MIKESEQAMCNLEKVFGKLNKSLETNFEEMRQSGLSILLTNMDKTFALMERIATRLKKRSWE